jgi:ribosome recycling factor
MINDLEKELKKTIEEYQKNLAGIRVGRANAQLVEDLKVDYYGSLSPLKQLSQITIPDSKTIMITPWNKDDLVSVEKAISESDLNLNPSNNGEAVILKLPPMTEERRQELVKIASRRSEDCRVEIRQKREKAIELLNQGKKEGRISEDELFSQKEAIQKLVDKFTKEADDLRDAKAKEINTI